MVGEDLIAAADERQAGRALGVLDRLAIDAKADGTSGREHVFYAQEVFVFRRVKCDTCRDCDMKCLTSGLLEIVKLIFWLGRHCLGG